MFFIKTNHTLQPLRNLCYAVGENNCFVKVTIKYLCNFAKMKKKKQQQKLKYGMISTDRVV